MADKKTVEEHPAFGQISVARVSGTGTVLFDSDVKHQHFIMIRIHRTERHRELGRDWLFPREELIEVDMSEAQWAGFVSSPNSSGVACTIRKVRGEDEIPPLELAPRLAESMKETREAAHRAFDEIKEALATYEAHKTVGNLRMLRAKIENAVANVDFAGKSLAEHTENVVQKARNDIESMVTMRAQQLGLDPGEIIPPKLLGSGE